MDNAQHIENIIKNELKFRKKIVKIPILEPNDILVLKKYARRLKKDLKLLEKIDSLHTQIDYKIARLRTRVPKKD